MSSSANCVHLSLFFYFGLCCLTWFLLRRSPLWSEKEVCTVLVPNWTSTFTTLQRTLFSSRHCHVVSKNILSFNFSHRSSSETMQILHFIVPLGFMKLRFADANELVLGENNICIAKWLEWNTDNSHKWNILFCVIVQVLISVRIHTKRNNSQ